jgi:Tol biopolymer transport system component
MRTRFLRRWPALAGLCLLVVLPISGAQAAYLGANGQIAFSRGGNLFLASADGAVGGSALATPGLNPSWNGEGTQIAYDDGTSIHIFTVSGSTDSGALTTGTDPSFSADGTKIAYVKANQIWTYVVSGGTTTALSNSTTVDADPTWSPDGSKITFSRKATGSATTAAIWTMNGDGSGQTQLTSGTSMDLRPNYTPSGATIAFESDRVGPTQIFTMTTSGANVTRITNTSTNESAPAYSPDAARILFVRSGAGIWWIPVGGGTPTQLTSGATDLAPDEQPAIKVGTVSLTGAISAGSTLTATPIGWQGRNLTYTYNWQRCDTAGNCAATFLTTTSTSSSSYTTVPADTGAKIQVVVTAANGSGTSSAVTSNAVGPITGGPGPVNTALPTITLPTGYTAPQIGFFLTATAGTWTGHAPITFKYQWTKCDDKTKNCYDIPDATSSFFTPTADLANWDISVTVYATNDVGTTYARAVPTLPVTGALPTNHGSPVISGQNYVKSQLTTSLGVWQGLAPITYAIQWKRCDAFGNLESCVAIAGATGSTYVLQLADLDKTIRVFVTATNPITSVTQFSNHTFPTLPERHYKPAISTFPAITGTTRPGFLLRATVGDWSGDFPQTHTYQWERCDATGATCLAISRATRNRYTVAARDLGSTIRVKVTATNPYGSASIESDPTDPITRSQVLPKGRRIVGTKGSDYLAGSGGSDRIYGLAGNDTLLGGNGNDYLDGGAGNDVIDGGKGIDHIYGGPGSDTILAGDGTKDYIDCGTGNDRVVADPIDVLTSCESVSFAAGTPPTTPTPTPPAPVEP